MGDGVDFWGEVLKELIGSTGAVLVAVVGVGIALWQSSLQATASRRREREKADEAARARLNEEVRQRREASIVGSLTTAYQRLENAYLRQYDWVQDHPAVAIRIHEDMERALADIQLLGDATNAERAARLCLSTDDPETFAVRFRDLLIGLRAELRARLVQDDVPLPPISLRTFPDGRVMAMSEDVARIIGGEPFVEQRRALIERHAEAATPLDDGVPAPEPTPGPARDSGAKPPAGPISDGGADPGDPA